MVCSTKWGLGVGTDPFEWGGHWGLYLHCIYIKKMPEALGVLTRAAGDRVVSCRVVVDDSSAGRTTHIHITLGQLASQGPVPTLC